MEALTCDHLPVRIIERLVALRSRMGARRVFRARLNDRNSHGTSRSGMFPQTGAHAKKFALLLVSASLAWLAASASATATPQSADRLMVVDCLLPGQVRQLGGQMTYLSPRR